MSAVFLLYSRRRLLLFLSAGLVKAVNLHII